SLGLPVEAFLRLYAVDASGSARQIRNVAEIMSLVERVNSATEAVQLLQLETSPETHFLFPDAHYLDVRVSAALERPGGLTEHGAIAARHTPLVAVMCEDGFEVSRDLVDISAPDQYALMRRREWVSPSGGYCLISETPVGSVPPAEILLPEYE